MDNNQKGHCLTFQRFGSSNKFVKVTARFYREAVIADTLFTYNETPEISYVDQIVMSPTNMPPFENVSVIDKKFLMDPLNCKYNGDKAIVDASRKRVSRHIDMLTIISFIQKSKKYLTGHNAKENKHKHWVNMPNEFKSHSRDMLVRKIWSKR